MRERTIALLVFLLTACGATAQQKALHATYIGVKAAEAGFVEWDHQHQADIVAHAESLPKGEAALSEYATKRAPILQAFMAVYQLLYLAAAETNQERIDAAIGAATTLYHLIELLKAPAAAPATTILDRPRRGVVHAQQRPRARVVAFMPVTVNQQPSYNTWGVTP